MNPETRVPLRRRCRCLGGLLMALGLLIGLGFWWWVIGIRSSAPDYSPHRSPAGFWKYVQTALHVSWWRYEHSAAIGAFGDKDCAEKIMETVAAGKDFEGYEGRYRDGALSDITNHDFSSHPDTRKAWQDWWRENKSKTQEQWIKEGFKLHGFDVALPPSKEDWPQLLHILGATAGPDYRPKAQAPEKIYPFHVCYNAYRWLRDSGFDPVRYFLDSDKQRMPPEQSGGLIDYGHFEHAMGAPPLPGKMAFASPPDWGYLGSYRKDRPPASLRPVYQISFTLASMLLFWSGWKLTFPHLGTLAPPSARRPKLGWAILCLGLLIGSLFWWGVIFVRGGAPDHDPHRSPAGFWQDVQISLRIGWRRHDDHIPVGFYGDKIWAEKIMHIVAEGGEFQGCAGSHMETALSFITNHDISAKGDLRKTWLDWWQANKSLTQEEWIQQGFTAHGFNLPLPPTEKDWPVLLKILGTTAGPDPREYRKHPEMLYPTEVRYNAYRWLRDSGFDPVRYAVTEGTESMTAEQSGGLIDYQLTEASLNAPPLPGRLAFALDDEWGYLGEGFQTPGILQTRYQILGTLVSLLLVSAGWLLIRPRKNILQEDV